MTTGSEPHSSTSSASPEPSPSEAVDQRLADALLEQGRRQQAARQERAGLNDQIDQLLWRVTRLEGELADLKRENTHMARSLAWRLSMVYWSARARLLRWLGLAQATAPNPPPAPRLVLPAARPAARPLAEAQPLFVIGCPRSGTTLVAKILNAHPAVLMTNETAVFIMLDYLIEKSRTGFAAGLLYGKEHNQLWADNLTRQARPLIEGYYADIAVASHKAGLQYWGEKHPHNVRCLAFIASLYPAARYLYLVRDPRDAALSIAAMNSVAFPEALAEWKVLSDGHERFIATLPPERLCPVRYETLVADYYGVTHGVFDWLGLDAAPVRDFVAQAHSVDAHTLDQAVPVRADFRAKSVGRWRRELGQAERQLAAELSGDFMDKYAYER